MKQHPLLLTILGNLILPIAAIAGANAATLQPPVTIPDSLAQPPETGIAPSNSNPTSPTFNPQGIQSILSSGGNLSTIFSGIVSAFPGLDPNIASALTTAAKYAPIAQSVLAGQQPTPAQIGQVVSGMNGGTAVGIKFGDWGLDSAGNIQPLNPDGSVKTDDPTGKMIAYQASNMINGKGLDTKAVIAQLDLAKAKSGSSVAEANRQNTNKAVSSIMSATGDANNSTLATGAAQANISAGAGSSFSRMGAMNNMLSQTLIMGATANTIGLANLSQGENQAKHNALVQQRNLAEDEQKRVDAELDALKQTSLEANKLKARARLCASSNICWN
jgi:hypothetical protein